MKNQFKFCFTFSAFAAASFLISCGGGGGDGEALIPKITKHKVLFTDEIDSASSKHALIEYSPETNLTKTIGADFYNSTDYGYDPIERITIIHKQKVYFSADTDDHGWELWVYDPLAKIADGVNPKMVVDLNPGASDAYPYSFYSLGDYLYFAAETNTGGGELMRYNPSEAVSATNPLEIEIAPGAANAYPNYFTSYNNKLYFQARSAGNDTELWVYNPSAALSSGVNPKLVQDIRPGSVGSGPSYLINFKNKLYFTADGGVDGRELWSYDDSQPASASNPQQVINLNPGSSGSSPRYFVTLGDDLYFSATSAASGTELWKYNPSVAASTTNPELVDIISGSTGSSVSYLSAIGGKIYMQGNHSNGDQDEVLIYDPSAAASSTNPKSYKLDVTSRAYPWHFIDCLGTSVCVSVYNSANADLVILDRSIASPAVSDFKKINTHGGTDAADLVQFTYEVDAPAK